MAAAAGGSRGAAEDAEHLPFHRWFIKNPFALMEAHLGLLQRPSTASSRRDARRRFRLATARGRRALAARGVVTALLALGILGTAVAALLGSRYPPEVARSLDRAAAAAGSVSFILLAARLALDRYVDLMRVRVTFLAMLLQAPTDAET